jgi:hypothetical protein
MFIVDEIVMDAPADVCFRTGADVERWPDVLPHYRWVHFQRKDGFGTGRVEMAARREFGPFPYPVWWVSEMKVDETIPVVLYEHVDGITRGMHVVWSFERMASNRTREKIVHDWAEGPAWPLPRFVCRLIADLIIGPIFIHHVASRTLAGIRTAAETNHTQPGPVTT